MSWLRSIAVRLIGTSKIAALLRREASVAEGMAELGKAMEAEIARQDREEARREAKP